MRWGTAFQASGTSSSGLTTVVVDALMVVVTSTAVFGFTGISPVCGASTATASRGSAVRHGCQTENPRRRPTRVAPRVSARRWRRPGPGGSDGAFLSWGFPGCVADRAAVAVSRPLPGIRARRSRACGRRRRRRRTKCGGPRRVWGLRSPQRASRHRCDCGSWSTLMTACQRADPALRSPWPGCSYCCRLPSPRWASCSRACTSALTATGEGPNSATAQITALGIRD